MRRVTLDLSHYLYRHVGFKWSESLRSKAMTAFVVFFGLSLMSTSAQANAISIQEHCGHDVTSNNVAYGWCIDRDLTSTNQDVVFYLHGLGGNEHTWMENDRDGQIRTYWDVHHYQQPTVITLSFGALYLLTDIVDPSINHPPYLPLVLNEILPALENKIGGVHGKRILMGESMGGFNSTQIMFAAPQMFDHVTLRCPAIADIGPYTPQADVEAFYLRNPWVDRDTTEGIRTWAHEEFPLEDMWNSHDPLQRIARINGPQLPPMLVNVDGHDSLGFTEGGNQFIAHALEMHQSVQSVFVPDGDHCIETDESIAQIAEFTINGK